MSTPGQLSLTAVAALVLGGVAALIFAGVIAIRSSDGSGRPPRADSASTSASGAPAEIELEYFDPSEPLPASGKP